VDILGKISNKIILSKAVATLIKKRQKKKIAQDGLAMRNEN
jgi:hypothetical protein